MSYDIALLADPHMNLYRRHNSFFIHVERMFDNFYAQCEKENVKYIFICGDLFHTKNYTSTEALLKANDILYKLSQIAEVHMIPGNHDIFRNNEIEINLLNNYKHYKNIFIYNNYDCKAINDIKFHFLPWNKDETLLKTDLEKISLNGGVLISHLAVNGFNFYTGEAYSKSDNTASITAADFENFKQVFLGHFHGYQNKGNIVYVSSPFQSRFGDENSKHGFVFYSSTTNEHKFVENIYSPQFITMDFTKENIKKLLSYKNHYIRLNINKHVTKELLMTIKHRLLKDNLDVEYKFNIAPVNQQFATLEGWDQVSYTSTDDLLAGFIKHLIKQDKIKLDFTEKELLDAILQ